MPQATSLAARIVQEFGVEPELVGGRGGVFDVAVDGDVIFSKRVTHRFPEPAEIVAAIQAKQPGRG